MEGWAQWWQKLPRRLQPDKRTSCTTDNLFSAAAIKDWYSGELLRCGCVSEGIISSSSCGHHTPMNTFPSNLTPPLSLHCPADKDRAVLFVLDSCFCPRGPSGTVRNSTMCCKTQLFQQMHLRGHLMWCRSSVTIRKIRSRLTDGANYCCQSNVDPTSAELPRVAAQVSGRRAFHYCPVSVIVTSHRVECVACHVLAACDTAHLPQDPGPAVLQAGGGLRKVPLERVHPSLMHPTNQCSSYPGALGFTCQCVCVNLISDLTGRSMQ